MFAAIRVVSDYIESDDFAITLTESVVLGVRWCTATLLGTLSYTSVALVAAAMFLVRHDVVGPLNERLVRDLAHVNGPVAVDGLIMGLYVLLWAGILGIAVVSIYNRQRTFPELHNPFQLKVPANFCTKFVIPIVVLFALPIGLMIIVQNMAAGIADELSVQVWSFFIWISLGAVYLSSVFRRPTSSS